MPVDLTTWTLTSQRGTAELAEVTRVAEALLSHLQLPEVQAAIDSANQPGKSSSLVQNVFLTEAVRLGFRSEAKGLFVGYPTLALRPDYFLPLPHFNTGILLEVERGKTTINNMDFLDFWKCHICVEADHLFLLVPRRLQQNVKGLRITKPYAAVKNRLSTFFEQANYTNVRSCWLFGY